MQDILCLVYSLMFLLSFSCPLLKHFSGGCFLCSVLVAPVKNENEDIIMFILNFEDITEAALVSDASASPRATTEDGIGALKPGQQASSVGAGTYRWRRGRSKLGYFMINL